MIKEVMMYTVVCDSCGVDVNKDADISAWSDKGYAEDCALDEDWKEESGKHYCENCWQWDDDGNLVFGKPRPPAKP